MEIAPVFEGPLKEPLEVGTDAEGQLDNEVGRGNGAHALITERTRKTPGIRITPPRSETKRRIPPRFKTRTSCAESCAAPKYDPFEQSGRSFQLPDSDEEDMQRKNSRRSGHFRHFRIDRNTPKGAKSILCNLRLTPPAFKFTEGRIVRYTLTASPPGVGASRSHAAANPSAERSF